MTCYTNIRYEGEMSVPEEGVSEGVIPWPCVNCIAEERGPWWYVDLLNNKQQGLANIWSWYQDKSLHRNTCWKRKSLLPQRFAVLISHRQQWLTLVKDFGGFIISDINETCFNDGISYGFLHLVGYSYIHFLSDNCWSYARSQKQS